uniref:Immediate early response 3-interacting protein 1 n=1 Tax=Amphiprion ocellaris TaxID=80972 RepID=A0AAQ5YE60_AMPOC
MKTTGGLNNRRYPLLLFHDLRWRFTAAASLGVAVGEEESASMAFTLYSLIQTAILCTNAVAVLHEERFLSKIECYSVFPVGWGVDQGVGGFGDDPGVKAQILNLIRSVRTVMRVPLIIVNSACIVLLLLFG